MKKKFLSLFLALSMITSLIVFPTAVLAGAENVIIADSVNLTRDPNTKKYTLSWEFKGSYATGGNENHFMFFTQAYLDNNEGELEAISSTNIQNNTLVNVNDPVNCPVIYTRSTDSAATSREVEIPAVLYNTNGVKFYIAFSTADATAGALATKTFELDKNGDIMLPQAYLTLNGNNGTIDSAATKDVNIDEGTYTAANLTTKIGVTPVRAGYKFAGWAENASDTTPTASVTLSAATNTAAARKNLYAVWTAKTTLTPANFDKSADVTYNGQTQTVTVTPKAGVTGIGTITVKYDGATGGKKDADTYPITIDVAEGTEYAAITGLALGNWTIGKADYTYAADINKSVPVGTTAGPQEITNVTVNGVNGETATGKFTATGTKTLSSEGEEDNVTWTFVPDTADANYNAFTKAGKIIASAKTVVTPTFTIPTAPVTYGDNYDATVTLNPNAANTVVYVNTADNSESATKPTAPGTYKVKVTLTDANSYKFADDTASALSGEFTIAKKTVKINPVTLTKVYDGNTTAKKADKSDLAMADLTLDTTGVTLVADGTFSATYNSKDVKDATKVTIGGVKLSDTDNYELDAASLEMPATITALPVVATLKTDDATKAKATRTYGDTAATSLAPADFTYDNGVTDADLADFTVATTADSTSNVGDYPITITSSTNGNYTVTTDSKVTVAPADYPAPAEVKGEIPIGTTVEGFTFDGKIKDLAGNDVEGTFTITSTDKGTAEAGSDITGLSWTFAPKTADANYNALSGTNGVLTPVDAKAENTKVPTVIAEQPTTVDGNGALVISKAADDNDTPDTAKVEYRVKGTDTWTEATFADGKVTVPVAPGTYEVRYAETDTTKAGASVEAEVKSVSTYKITATVPGEDAHGKFTYTVGENGTPVDNYSTTAAVISGTPVTITATPDNGYRVDKVTVTKTGTSETVKTTGSYKFDMPDNDVNIEVTFRKRSSGGGGGGVTSYTVTYDADKNGKITEGKSTESVTSGAKPKAVPEITANEGYTFLGWSQDGTTVVDPTTVTITKRTTFKALYEEATAPTPTPIPTEKPDTNAHDEYIYGYEDGDFRPENGITRAETAAIFARALTDYSEGTTYESAGFIDLDGTEWFINNVNYLANAGVITGYEDGTFRPYESISRQEFATMITKLGEVLEAGDMPFNDVSEENWGIDYIYTAYVNGLVTGYEDGTFRPENSITRAEAVTIVNGYLGREVDAEGLANVNYTQFPDVTTSHWAYYQIIEAANAHDFVVDTKPEVWVD